MSGLRRTKAAGRTRTCAIVTSWCGIVCYVSVALYYSPMLRSTGDWQDAHLRHHADASGLTVSQPLPTRVARHLFPSPAPNGDFCMPLESTLGEAELSRVLAAGFDNIGTWVAERQAALDSQPCFEALHRAPDSNQIRVGPIRLCGEII